MGEISFRKVAWLLISVFFLYTPVEAQTSNSSERWLYLGASFQLMKPMGDFRQNLGPTSWKNQGALGFDLIAPLMSSGLLNLRLDYLFGSYKASPCNYCNAYGFKAYSVGPEVVLLHGRIRPYLNASYGRLSFYSNTDSSYTHSNRTNADTGTGALIYGSGVRIEGKRRNYGSRWTVDYDLGFRGYSAGPASYQNQSTQQPDGTVAFGFVHSRTPFFMYTMGLQFRYNTACP
jgi:hypothetical protein